MKLTDEQYSQILRYVEGEMEADERKVFVGSLSENNELHKEVELYKELQSLGRSIERKFYDTGLLLSGEKTDDEEVNSLIGKARENWKKQQESERRTHEFTVNETSLPRLPVEKKHAGLKNYLRKWQAAAVFAGLVLAGISGWYFYDQRMNGSSLFVHKKADSNNAGKYAPDSSGKMPAQNPPPSQKELVYKDTIQVKAPQLGPVQKNEFNINKDQRKVLLAAHFVPDALPEDKADILEEAFKLYQNSDYEHASRAYEEAVEILENLDVRAKKDTKQEQRRMVMIFYARYYNGQSYLADDKAVKAAEELKKALQVCRDKTMLVKTRWYLALAFLGSGQQHKTAQLLKQVAGNNDEKIYKQKAVHLIKDLNKP